MYPGTWELEHAGPVGRMQSSATGTPGTWSRYHGHGRIGKHTEGGWDTDDYALALKLLGNVDFVAGRGLDELDGWDGVADLDIEAGRRLEGAGGANGTWSG